MQGKIYRILAVNPGSSSTKIAYFENETCKLEDNLVHPAEELQDYVKEPMQKQLPYRLEKIIARCKEFQIDLKELDAVVGRGGLLKPLKSGTYRVSNRLLADLFVASRGEHASNLGAMLADKLAQPAQALACIVDPVSVDELQPEARLSGLQGMDRECLSHALNTKAIAKRYAKENKQAYEKSRLIVAHLGSGISISAHKDGRMIDVTNPRDEGAFSPERAGTLPVMPLIKLCYSGDFTQKEMIDKIFKEGGVFSYCGYKDVRLLIDDIADNANNAQLVFAAMVYQIAKETGAMATVLNGKVDAILLTGGMAKSQELVEAVREKIAWIAPVKIYPGEDELKALMEGALRVLRGQDAALMYR